MASTGQKWAIGCGVGCGLLVLVLVLVGGGVFLAVKDVLKDGKHVEESFEELSARFGDVEDFRPTPDGSVPAERMEIFLAVRAGMAPQAEKLTHVIHVLDDDDGVEVDANPVEKIKAGLSLLPSIMGYLETRNKALMQHGMGSGEFIYIYSLAYFSYLHRDVADGPNVELTGAEDGSEGGISIRMEGKKQSREEREKEIRRHLHRLQLAFLVNQVADAGEVPELLAERDRMVDNAFGLLWEEGLPPAIAASFAPYREQLEKGYIPILNLVEVGVVIGD